MSARRLCAVVHSMLVEGHGAEKVDEMLHGEPEMDTSDRVAMVLAMGGEVA